MTWLSWENMCRLHNIRVIVNLHAAPGAQNPNEHSGTRDGSQTWGTTAANIAQTVQVIEFLATRFLSIYLHDFSCSRFYSENNIR
jgi:hypothetical protein